MNAKQGIKCGEIEVKRGGVMAILVTGGRLTAGSVDRLVRWKESKADDAVLLLEVDPFYDDGRLIDAKIEIVNLQPSDEVSPAREEPNFLVDDRGYVSFWADGDDSPCAELDLLLDGDGEDPEFSLLEGGDMHDGFSSISAIAERWPRVSDSLEGWKRGETFAFSELLQAAKDARKDLEANNA